MNKKKILRTIPALIWMYLIYWLSDRPALESTAQSEDLTFIILKAASTFTGFSDAEVMDRTMLIEPCLRETAHFAEYAVLGLLVLIAVGAYMKSDGKRAMISFLICFIYALTDEVHQLYIPGRTFQLIDIILDTAGAALVMIVFLAVKSIRRKGTY